MPLDLSHFANAPFYLDSDALSWVESTFHKLDDIERVAQLFNLNCRGDDIAAELERLGQIKPGAITRGFGADGLAERSFMQQLQAAANVPLLVSADLEGSRMSQDFGTPVPNALALAAIDDLDLSEAVFELMAREARSVGLNWSFTPMLDINASFRSPIVATRSFGSDPEVIARHALKQIEVFQREGLAATIKHWPGEGYDDRDQHLVTTINPLSMETWQKTFGALYKRSIDRDAKTVMSAHISLPSYMRKRNPQAGAEAYDPASINAALNIDLLRGELGFNGLIISDASEMAGLSSLMTAVEAKIELIANGCDMVLFSSNPMEEIEAVWQAVQTGRISTERFTDAVTRVLALKASLNLHKELEAPVRIGETGSLAVSQEAFGRAPTLVKDLNQTLPLDPAKHRRILVISSGIIEPMRDAHLEFHLPDMLAKEGFEITLHSPEQPLDFSKHDLVLYLLGDETLLTRGRIFIDWRTLHGGFRAAMQRPWTALPTVMISFGYPYMLYDAPRVPTYINAYSTHEMMQDAVLEALMGRREWNTNSPIDPFGDAPDAQY